MSSATASKSVGREAACDLTLDQPGIAQQHAKLILTRNGLISLVDNDSNNGTYVNRNDRWVRIKRMTLCIGDRIRFAELEVPLEQLTSVFGEHSNARLEARHFAIQGARKTARSAADLSHAALILNKPVRNPVTGKIEEQGK